MRLKRILYIACLMLASVQLMAQQGSITGTVKMGEGDFSPEGIEVVLEPGYQVFQVGADGRFSFKELGNGDYRVVIFGKEGPLETELVRVAGERVIVNLNLDSTACYELETVVINNENGHFGMDRKKSVDGFGIYAAKKNELIYIESLKANLASNNSRQIFGRVSGLNIWESDGAGLQLGIGGRGLSPNRTSNFNVRQNGYDISADAMGYPESYYTPPSEAIQRIEVIRGAASLQYGTQFGGMLNFIFRQGPEDKPVELVTRQTVGSFGFFNSFNSLGGTAGKWNYYGYFQRKSGNGWRENSGFEMNSGHFGLRRKFSEKFKMGMEFTHTDYLAQQPGGLTDALFQRDPRQSTRDRNWFRVDWNLFALKADLKISRRTKLNTRNFGLIAQRDALGFLGLASRADHMQERDLLVNCFKNFGNETRLITKYNIKGLPGAFLTGFRYYQGFATGSQGLSTDGFGPEFQYLNPEQPEYSDFRFPSRNVSGFFENMFTLSPKFTLTLGGRYEYIHTSSEGYYIERTTDLAGNIIFEQQLEDFQDRERNLFLGGIGLSYRANASMEVYANASQNYRAINFNDLRVVNPNFRVDENLRDERGYNADLGVRGTVGNFLRYDATAFFLNYSNRIGLILRQDTVLYNLYRFRTNIADSRTVGIESYIELDIYRLLRPEQEETSLSIFSNLSLIHARYVNSEEPAIQGKEVELVPPVTLRTGINFSHKKLGGSLQYSYTHRHFTDATNAEFTASAINGIIPSYSVMDFSLFYEWRALKLEGSVNNLTNNFYFTRRAAGYPGPGIIPSDGRAFFLTLQFKLNSKKPFASPKAK